jgi:hypothetical protein
MEIHCKKAEVDERLNVKELNSKTESVEKVP